MAPLVSVVLRSSLEDASIPNKPPPMVLVVTPTLSLIEDQVKRCEEMGLKSIKLESFDEHELDQDVVFATPEAFLGKTWRKVLLSQEIRDRVMGVVIDEAHLVVKW